MKQREIKFRGQHHITKKWIYGYLMKVEGDFYIQNASKSSEVIDLMNTTFKVIPETIGQFTGLKDKNKKEIYEGDILKQGEGEHETLIEVRFGEGTFDSGAYKFTGFYGVYVKIGFGGGFKPGMYCEDMDEITKNECDRREVIGNIYENPELLDEKK